MKNLLYLASKSPSRKKLLEMSGIPFTVLEQSADEQECDWTLSLPEVVEAIAIHKMESLDWSTIGGSFSGAQEDHIWVLTADTLGQDARGRIYGKPADMQEAIAYVKQQRDQWVRVATSFCLVRHVKGQTHQRKVQTVMSEVYFSISDEEIEEYLIHTGALACAGAMVVDGFGAQYVKAIKGSYSSIIGLPLYEVKQALHELNFFKLPHNTV